MGNFHRNFSDDWARRPKRMGNYMRAQTSVEYMITLAVVLLIAIAVIAILGFFANTSGGTQLSESRLYWTGSAKPISIYEAASYYGTICSTENQGGYLFAVANTGVESLSITNITIENESVSFCEYGSDPADSVSMGAAQKKIIGVVTSPDSLPCNSGQLVGMEVSFTYTKRGLKYTEEGQKDLVLICSVGGIGGNCQFLSENCTVSSDCCGSLRCIGNACSRPSGPSGACTVSSDCANNLRCMDGGTCESCLLSRSTCSRSDQCCSSSCSAGNVCCIGLGSTGCSGNGDCCSGLVCNLATSTCESCHGSTEMCSGTSECCNGMNCVNGYCAACNQRDDACSVPSDCCESGNLTCIDSSCQTCHSPSGPSDECSGQTDCCSGLICTPSGLCQTCIDSGQVCADSSQCCGSRLCLPPLSGSGPNTCQDCRGASQSCSTGSDCCSGLACISGQCKNCLNSGWGCTNSSDCCVKPGVALTCNAQGASSVCCAPSGSSCIQDSDCCSGYQCIMGQCDTPHAEGGSCIVSSDCQPGLSCFPNGNGAGTCGTCVRRGNYCTAQVCCSGFTCQSQYNSCQACKKQDESCRTDGDCCSGMNCNPDSHTCQTCQPQGGVCGPSSACCTGVCGESGTCTCIDVGAACTGDSDCCGNVNANVNCVGTAGAKTCQICPNSGAECTSDDQCCGGLSCIMGQCSTCHALNLGCSDGPHDCCSELCASGACICNNVFGYCTKDVNCCAGSCNTNNNKCCQLAGGSCNYAVYNDTECCSSAPFCNSNGQCSACRDSGGICTSTAQCCSQLACISGKCTACVAENSTCTGDAECCKPLACIASGTGPNQCTNCERQGSPCVFGNDCCTGVCDVTSCSCLPTGQPCTSNLNCCSGTCDAGTGRCD